MKHCVMLGSLSVVVSIGVAMYAFGQHNLLTSLAQQTSTLTNQGDKLDAAIKDREFLKAVLEKQLAEQKKVTDDLDAEMAKLIPDNEGKKTDLEACHAELATMNEEVAGVEKEQLDSTTEFNTQTETWKAEMDGLRQQLQQRSKVCSFVRQDPAALKLCENV